MLAGKRAAAELSRRAQGPETNLPSLDIFIMHYINGLVMLPKFITRLGFVAVALLGAVVGLGAHANAAELVMFRRDGCSWCAKWDREIGPIYPKTEFSRRAPLRQVNLDRDRNAAIVHLPIRYTPTFVLAEDGRELGRIEGYPGDDFFWPRLEQLLEHLPQPPAPNGISVPGASPVPAELGR